MENQKERSVYRFNDKEKEFSKDIHSWLAQYDEEDDFLSGRASNALVELSDDE